MNVKNKDRMNLSCQLVSICVFSALMTFIQCDDKMWTKNELKILVEPGYRECFYQFVELEAVFHSSFQVIKGEGIGFEVIDPKGISVIHLANDQSGSHQVQKAEARGDYSICFDNTYSHLTSKLVSIYILTFQTNLMQKKIVEDQIYNETHNAVKTSANKISMNIVEIFTHQAMARFRNTRDEYTIDTNNTLIIYWSVFQSFLIIMCGCFQVYFVKRLFQTSRSSSIKTGGDTNNRDYY